MSVPTHVRNVDFAQGLSRGLLANSSASAYAALAKSTAKPDMTQGSGTIDTALFGGGANCPRFVFVVLIGEGANNATASFRLSGWRQLGATWIPYPLLEVDGILSQDVGLAGNTDLSDSERAADTFSLVLGNQNVDVTVVSPANDTPAHLLMDLKGSRLLTFQTKVGTATKANLLYGIL